eukprot:COSAG05_NODE_2178_length_3433_cov_77.463707_1_plen_203_part_00
MVRPPNDGVHLETPQAQTVQTLRVAQRCGALAYYFRLLNEHQCATKHNLELATIAAAPFGFTGRVLAYVICADWMKRKVDDDDGDVDNNRSVLGRCLVGAWSGLGRARARAYGSGKQHMSSIKTACIWRNVWPERSRAVFATLRAHHPGIDELGRELVAHRVLDRTSLAALSRSACEDRSLQHDRVGVCKLWGELESSLSIE